MYQDGILWSVLADTTARPTIFPTDDMGDVPMIGWGLKSLEGGQFRSGKIDDDCMLLSGQAGPKPWIPAQKVSSLLELAPYGMNE